MDKSWRLVVATLLIAAVLFISATYYILYIPYD